MRSSVRCAPSGGHWTGWCRTPSRTLPRLNLAEAVLRHDGPVEAFFATTLPHYVEMTAELMETRIRFLVEESGFYEHDWLVQEGLISLDRFSAMFGLYGRAMLHSQSGIDSDVGVTAGTRIPIGSEPDLYQHLAAEAPHHELFAAGVSDILHFNETAVRNPEAVVDVIRGAFVQGMREFTFNLDSNDFIRITGDLVRKSDPADVDTGARLAGP